MYKIEYLIIHGGILMIHLINKLYIQSHKVKIVHVVYYVTTVSAHEIWAQRVHLAAATFWQAKHSTSSKAHLLITVA